ncbi:MAG: 23S rRNA (adenine(2503)-C(2))-methyltransferase RlmN [Desulfobacteraceae bacterium]|nr:MAG: 23S rRNA (adenine(2503)-C(2))-methyltransferase RlmN [Desulfobacteraceae bacterium]
MSASDKPNLLDLTKQDLIDWLQLKGIAAYRASQIFKWVFIRQADQFEQMSDLKKDLRDLLADHFTIAGLDRIRREVSVDGSRKYLFQLCDGNRIESVLIPERDHHTLCISTQVGCAQGCRFCLTARSGFVRNLTPGEIIAQVREVQKELTDSERLTNLVLMGMGEPLANYGNVVAAIQVFTNCEEGLKFSNRRVTLSTSGLVPKIAELATETRVSLAVSLNATENATRSRLMPINRKYPIETLLDACRKFPLRSGRRITIEYILIEGVNDSEQDAERLSKLLRPDWAKVNLIPFNEFEACGFRRPEEPVIQRFHEVLLERRFTTVIRQSKGRDISAACGQLSANREEVRGQKSEIRRSRGSEARIGSSN